MSLQPTGDVRMLTSLALVWLARSCTGAFGFSRIMIDWDAPVSSPFEVAMVGRVTELRTRHSVGLPAAPRARPLVPDILAREPLDGVPSRASFLAA